MTQFIQGKHGINEAQLDKIEVTHLGQYLQSQKVHKWATLVKLIQGWNATYKFLHIQNRQGFAICLCCQSCNETKEHVMTCIDDKAISHRIKSVHNLITALSKASTDPNILKAIMQYIKHILNLPHETIQHTEYIREAIHHQNIIGWHQFICGYISTKWGNAQEHFEQINRLCPQPNWRRRLISAVLHMHLSIWEDCNNFLYRQERQCPKL